MIEGRNGPVKSLFEELETTAKFTILAVPALGFAGLLILAGCLALGDRQKFGDVWLCLPAGVLMAGLLCFLACHVMWIRPRRTIWAFQFDGMTLAFETVTGWHTHSSRGITRITPIQTRRGGLVGWEFDVPDFGLTILPISMPNAQQLISALSDPNWVDWNEPVQPAAINAPAEPKKKSSNLGQDRGLSFGWALPPTGDGRVVSS